MSVVDKIQHYQRNIEKCTDNEDRILHCISKLYTLPVTVQHLQETGVGRTVNALRKFDGGVGNAAKALVAKWKAMVADEETTEDEDEDEACVPDAPESYSDSSEFVIVENEVAADISKTSRTKNDDSNHKHQHRTKKSDECSTSQNSKHVSKRESKTKHEESQSTRNESEKTIKHKHTSKYESKDEKKSSSKESKSGKNTSVKHSHSSKEKNYLKSEGSKKSADKNSDSNEINSSGNNDEYHRKRKLDNANYEKRKIKRRKDSNCDSDKDSTELLSSAEKHSINDAGHESQRRVSEIKVKEESCLHSPKDKDAVTEVDMKYEKRKLQEKYQSSSSKSKHKEGSSKLKDNAEKHRYKKDEINAKSEKNDMHHSVKESSKSKNSHSSSNSKDHSKNKEKTKRKEDKNDKSKQGELKNTKANKETSEKVKIKQELNGDEGIDCNSGASFAEALGMCTVQPLRKRNNNSPNVGSAKVIKTEPSISPSLSNKNMSALKTEPTSSDSHDTPCLLAPNVKLEPLSVDLASTLPEISPNYKPLPYINPIHRKEEDKFLHDVIYVKNQRTKVFSGNKTGYTSVPTLYELCIRVLMENIDALEFTGGVPYYILKPVLERATADQLFMLEHYNPYLIEDTDSLWQFHCNREFRSKQREEMESWREMYMRCLDEREAKLKTLTANIKQSIDKSVPLRSTKLAYVDNVVKPPRNVLKKQAKYGTANATSTSDLKKKLIAGGGSTGATNISVPPPPMARVRTSSSAVVKKTKAPLMAKALQLIKGRYKR